ncbi:MAG: F0F1 ATP synthase subunit alpha, partial [Planctomycetales bacterium]
FARFGTRLDDETRAALERGRRVREILKQSQHQPLSAAEQVVVLLAVNEGVFDPLPLNLVRQAEHAILAAIPQSLPDLARRMESGDEIAGEDKQAILRLTRKVVQQVGVHQEESS